MKLLATIRTEDRINSHPIIKWYYNLGDQELIGTYDPQIYEGNNIDWDNSPEDDDSWEEIEDQIRFLYDEAAEGGELYKIQDYTVIIAPYNNGTCIDYQWGLFKPHSHERCAGGYADTKQYASDSIKEYIIPQQKS